MIHRSRSTHFTYDSETESNSNPSTPLRNYLESPVPCLYTIPVDRTIHPRTLPMLFRTFTAAAILLATTTSATPAFPRAVSEPNAVGNIQGARNQKVMGNSFPLSQIVSVSREIDSQAVRLRLGPDSRLLLNLGAGAGGGSRMQGRR